MKRDARKIKDLDGVGKATLEDFHKLNIYSISQLRRQDPVRLFERLNELSGTQDICVLDVLRCAVEQAKNPDLPKNQRQWWYWSRKRKSTKNI
jgi:hypothetical protein